MIQANELTSAAAQMPKTRTIDRTGKQVAALDLYFSKGGSLTVAEAIRAFGVYALSQRCGDLRKKGKPVVSAWETTPDGAKIKRYRYAIQLELPCAD